MKTAYEEKRLTVKSNNQGKKLFMESSYKGKRLLSLTTRERGLLWVWLPGKETGYEVCLQGKGVGCGFGLLGKRLAMKSVYKGRGLVVGLASWERDWL